MSKFAKLRNSKKSVLRTRAVAVTVGLGASVALGAGIANAADSGLTSLTSNVSSTVAKQADAQTKAVQSAKKAANAWVKPVDNYTLGSTFGIAGSHWSHNHSGQDFVVPTGTAVKAVHNGTVVKAGPNGGGDGPAYGNAIVIKHANGMYTQYAHLSQIKVSVGQTVKTGELIGLSGSTGNSTGPHLHFEVRTGPNYGSGIEPTGFLRAHGDAV
ncbi:M23 family metallopeptidase [Streptomyces catenulae]|uniref:M23 family metallopeptidase n=1 Tax=Streptomyces catenulae TaxID=66875 RepID=A0ABV2Z7U5_9ACTN|nr:M23 family metallopeptidase [Streptomyces catenulae]